MCRPYGLKSSVVTTSQARSRFAHRSTPLPKQYYSTTLKVTYTNNTTQLL